MIILFSIYIPPKILLICSFSKYIMKKLTREEWERLGKFEALEEERIEKYKKLVNRYLN